MNIAFFLDNHHVPGIDFSHPERGNPGVGACEYLHVAIPFFLRLYGGHDLNITILAPHIDRLPASVRAVQAGSVREAATRAKELGVDFFVFRPRQKEEDYILDHIDALELPTIGRAALTPHPEHVRKMARSRFFKVLVCVGREQYDSLVDTPIAHKRAYIDNGIHVMSCWEGAMEAQAKDSRLVVYMGALVPMKGFHVLARAWPQVLVRHPDAKLSVIGSVKMYGDGLTVGPLGVASDDYERTSIMPYLCDANGRVHSSVTFHGQMGPEKFDLLRRAIVGVANPTGQTETCCVSAVEMAACKTAVVSGAYYALLDTVRHGKTGLLGRGVDDLTRDICRLLDDPAYAMRLGLAGFERAAAQYDFAATTPRWLALFDNLQAGRMPTVSGHLRNIQYHYKALRLINAVPQRFFGRLLPWPSMFEVQKWLSARSRIRFIFSPLSLLKKAKDI